MTVPATPRPNRSTGAPWQSGRRLWGWSIPTWLPSSKTMPIYYESWAAQNKRRLWKRAPGRSEPELLLIRPLAKLPLPLVGKGEGEGKGLNFIRNTRTPPRTLQMHVSRPDTLPSLQSHVTARFRPVGRRAVRWPRVYQGGRRPLVSLLATARPASRPSATLEEPCTWFVPRNFLKKAKALPPLIETESFGCFLWMVN